MTRSSCVTVANYRGQAPASLRAPWLAAAANARLATTRASNTTAVLAKAPATVGGREPKCDALAGRDPSATAVNASAAPIPTPTSSGLIGNALTARSFGGSDGESLVSVLWVCDFRARLARVADARLDSSVALFDMTDPGVARFELAPRDCARRVLSTWCALDVPSKNAANARVFS